MNISLLVPKFAYNQNNRNDKVAPLNRVHCSANNNLSQLRSDTVSFTGVETKFVKAIGEVKNSGSTILERLGAHYETVETPRLVRIANTYISTLFTACERLKSRGFSFDLDYNSQHPVKSAKSYQSKIERQKSLKVHDVIRGTVYCKDPYDIANIDAFISEMYNSGYVLSKIDEPLDKMMKKGYIPTPEELQSGVKTISVPDIDFRLDMTAEDIERMPQNLRYFVSGRLPSGLEDVQMRFIRTCDIKKRNPVYHELLVMFGEHSTAAKHAEHRDVFSHLRRFKELELPLEDTSIQTHAGKAKKYISLINDMFRGKVSQKLFLNAKNKDYMDLFDEVKIEFDEDSIRLFEGYFNGLRARISSEYAALRKETPTANRMKARDMARIQEIYQGLKDTINFYNHRAGLPLAE